MMVRDAEAKAAYLVPWTSVKAKCVCRSVLVAELLAFVGVLDIGLMVRDAYLAIFSRGDMAVWIYTVSRSLYHLVISTGRPMEEILLVDLFQIREAYEIHDLGASGILQMGLRSYRNERITQSLDHASKV